ncbi:MAG: glucuronide permease [Hungatella sp.]|jgi:Na+/melibiose symporter-like transporter|nr:glucuronide permease [Hungatella sp.]
MAEKTNNTGVHRAKLWEIGFYALNNTSTNLYMSLVGYISYYLIGIVGVGVVFAGSFITFMRVWDGVTDPFVGMLVDRTNTKFGKNRPFIVLGNAILFTTTWLMFNVVTRIGQGARLPVFIVIYLVYILGYTAQCVVTKSAQTCLTNDPKQRPIFAMFDTIYNLFALSVIIPIYMSGTLIPKFSLNMAEHAEQINNLIAKNPNLANVLETGEDGVQKLSGFYNPAMFQSFQLLIGGVAAVFACLAIVGLWRKDRIEYFGTGQVQKVTFKDYVDVLAHNRGIQMLVVAASSDKLSLSMQTNSTVMVCIFGVICGNYAYFGSQSAISAIPVAILSLLGMGIIARNLGQKKALVVGTVGALATAAGMLCLFLFGTPTNMMLPSFSLTKPATWGNLFSGANWSMFGFLYILLWSLMKGFSGIASSIVIPMTADCADYEVYRSGKYVPGLMGTLFSFVDKLISSLASTFVSVMFAAIGFKAALPTPTTPYSTGIFWVTMACLLGAPTVGWILNVVAMKFYPLSKEKMEEIQDRIAEIKAQAAKA